VSEQETPDASSSNGRVELDALSCLNPCKPVDIVSRCFSGFGDGQGDVIRAVKGKLKSITFTGAESADELFRPGLQYVVIIDRDDKSVPRGYEVMQKVNRELTRQFLEGRSAALQLNDSLESRITELDPHVWNIRRFKVSANLSIVVVTPV
jgi:hypothetical protein